MKRRDFISTTATATTAVIITSSLQNTFAAGPSQLAGTAAQPDEMPEDFANVSAALREQTDKLLDWLKEKGWSSYINKISGKNIEGASSAIQSNLVAEIDVNLFKKEKGFDDFAGKRLIQPGEPALSLLYHALASPRVKLPGITEKDKEPYYPTIEQIDTLENFIYALKKYDDSLLKRANVVIALFSYEYRTAFKTPHHKHADLVFSRAGISRIGDRGMNYNKELRCFLNLPLNQADVKHIAVTPAKYAVFLAEAVKKDDIALMTKETQDHTRDFLRPFRKLFNDDVLLDNVPIVFSEYHCSEKLKRLTEFDEKGIKVEIPPTFDTNKPPFNRISSSEPGKKHNSYNSDLVTISQHGSSALLAAYPHEDLIRPALQNKIPVRFLVPPLHGKGFQANRRYTSLKLQYKGRQNAYDYILTEFLFKRSRSTRFSAPRNSPLFVNIRNEVDEKTGLPVRYLGPEVNGFESEIEKSYWAAMFEDDICDGCVHAHLVNIQGVSSKNILKPKLAASILPAFSLVTAPDFFPDTDSRDIKSFDKNKSTNFLQGGSENLCTARKRPNPATRLPGTVNGAFPDVRVKDPKNIQSIVYDTLTAVLSHKPRGNFKSENAESFQKPQRKDYTSNSYLPDTASFIFAPGWDVTYSGNSSRNISEQEIFLATYGLGSPFAEDMKLCAAANGMWPVASPDASRTFKATIEPVPTGLHGNVRNPVSVPLMDNEIGIHADSPAAKEHGAPPDLGWDGEQGPYLEKLNGKLYVNFTDIGRADYVKNVLDHNLDMSNLRKLTTAQLIARMEALRKCVKELEGKKTPAYSRLWLVSAEEVLNWSNKAKAFGIPNDLVGNSNAWAQTFEAAGSDPGYLFVFAETQGGSVLFNPLGKRKRRHCSVVHVCKVSTSAIDCRTLKNNTSKQRNNS